MINKILIRIWHKANGFYVDDHFITRTDFVTFKYFLFVIYLSMLPKPIK